ncbi:TrmH family RNA methyltransferase [Candidatus Microgenomates bacterium]|nr:TrmH family RNA methyltransferase [Candidatus Microgenomates bacterium]
MIKLGARELRTTKASTGEISQIKKNPIYIILDNVLDTYNVGAIFRLADAVAAEKVILCGETEIPPNSRIKKASINTTEWISWEYAPTAVEALRKLKIKNEKLKIVAIEQSRKSVSYDKADYQFPIALVVGNETAGVSPEVLKMADQIVEIPMWGVNKSLNVMVSLGIVLFEAMKSISITD